jgi:benzoyl-CoA reductase subunit C
MQKQKIKEMDLNQLLKFSETLYEDLDLSAVKEWKERTGGKAIGYLPVYVPREIIHAAGMLPVGIMGGGDNLEIIRGDAFYQSYICHIPRSTIELGLAGKLDALDGMLFPAICDVIRNLSGIWKILFKDRYVKYMDFPQNFNPNIGGKFYRYELQELKTGLETLGGKEISNQDLTDSIKLYNLNREAIDALYRFRAEAPHQISSYELYILMRAGNILEVTEHTKLLDRYMDLVSEEERPKRDYIRVLVTGVFCEQPPASLIRALEQSGCYIVDDDWALGARYLQKNIEEAKDPLEALVNAYLYDGTPNASRYIDQEEKGVYLLNRVRELQADGVIFAAPSFCDPALLEQPMLVDALEREGVPHTAFKYSENTGQFQVIKEQTGTFADSIKLWGDQ